MKITTIEIENYKSIKYLHLKLTEKLNVFIGENSVGKSNVFDAINWLLGPVYPSFNATQPQDHYLGDVDNEIKIKLTFDDGNYLELAEKWYFKGYEKSGLNLSGNYVQDTVRQKYCSAYLGVDRAIMDYLPSNRWSLMGRILLEINEQFKNETFVDESTGEIINKTDYFKQELETLRDDVLFSVRDESGQEIMKKFISILQTESAKQLNRPESEFKVDLNLYDPWNFYRTLQLVVQESDTNLSFQASNLGMGIQASISIAILKAYSQIKLKNSTPIFIDEPELFLHPHAQLNFYRVLQDLANNGTQIFITTHSPNFLNIGNFDEINVVRKSQELGTYVNTANPEDFVLDLKIRNGITTNVNSLMEHYRGVYDFTGDTQKANEAFFAKKIILVEGQSESLILPYFFELSEFDYIAEGITIVRCGDKGQLDTFYRLYSEFGIPCYIMFDGDKQNEGTQDSNSTKKKNKALLNLFDIDSEFPEFTIHDKFLAFEYRLEEGLGIDCGSSKGLKLYRKVKGHFKSKDELPDWVSQFIEKIINMDSKTDSILKKEKLVETK